MEGRGDVKAGPKKNFKKIFLKTKNKGSRGVGVRPGLAISGGNFLFVASLSYRLTLAMFWKITSKLGN